MTIDTDNLGGDVNMAELPLHVNMYRILAILTRLTTTGMLFTSATLLIIVMPHHRGQIIRKLC